MLRRTLTSIARITAISSLFCIPVYAQNSDEASVFSERPISSQDAYIQVSVTMAALIAGQMDADMGACIDEWYTAADGVRTERNRELRAKIAEFSNFHVSAVILALVQQACGEFAD